jgi:nucleotide-binding universal stress UspA family protein
MYSKILVPIDGSNPSNLGLREAIKLAEALGARISLIHVLDVHALLTSGAAAASYDAAYDWLHREGADALNAASAIVSRAGIPVDAAMVEAPAEQVGECIVRQAGELQAELIICGTHGRRGVRRLLMGSDAEYIVRLSPVPVLLVRAQNTIEARAVPMGADAWAHVQRS